MPDSVKMTSSDYLMKVRQKRMMKYRRQDAAQSFAASRLGANPAPGASSAPSTPPIFTPRPAPVQPFAAPQLAPDNQPFAIPQPPPNFSQPTPDMTLAPGSQFATSTPPQSAPNIPPTTPISPYDTLSGYEPSTVAPGFVKPLPENELLHWHAPSRPFKKHHKKFFTTIVVIALLISLIFVFAGQGVLPPAVAFSVTFLVYVLFTIPPQDIDIKITSYGVRVENNLYSWQELGRFWFDEKYGQKLIYIETMRFPGRVTFLLADQSQEQLTEILSDVLLNKKPDPTFFEKAATWLSHKVPLDID